MPGPADRHQEGRDPKLLPGNDSAMPPPLAVKWMFTTDKARTKIGRAYPTPT